MDISCGADGENITVREDCGAVALVHGFFLPFGKISQKKSKEGVTLLICFCDNQGWRSEVFLEKSAKQGVTKQGGDLDNQW